MPTSPNSSVMAASCGSEVTTALNRFVTVMVDSHLGPNLEDLTRRLRNTELTQEASGNKEQQLEQRVAHHQERLQSLEKALNAKACNDQVSRLQTSLDTVMAEQARNRTQQERLVEELTLAMGDLKSRVAEAEQSIINGAEQLERLEAVDRSLDRKMEVMEEELTAKRAQHQQLKDSLAKLSGELQEQEQKSLQIETAMVSLQSQYSQVQQGLQDKVTTGTLQSLKSLLSSMEGKMLELEQSLQEKAASGNFQQLKQAVSMLETKLAGVDQAVHDKVGAGQMQQLKSIVMGIQNQANSLEQSMQDKVGSEQLQQLKASAAQVQAQLSSCEQQLQEKAPASHVQALKAAVATLDTKLLGCDQALQDKVDAAQWNQINDSVQVIQKKVGNIERGVWEGMDCVQGLEGALTSLKGQVATVEHNLQEKVCSEDVQRLGDVVITLKGKVGSLEQNLRQGAEHVTDVEGAVVSINKQLQTVKQVFSDMHSTQAGGVAQGRMLTLDLDRDRKSRRREDS